MPKSNRTTKNKTTTNPSRTSPTLWVIRRSPGMSKNITGLQRRVPNDNSQELRTQQNINVNENLALPPPLRDDRQQHPTQQNTRNAQQYQEEQKDQIIHNGRQEKQHTKA